MIPLAFYSLDHPRAPLLLADFRNSLKPKAREMVRARGHCLVERACSGITRFGNWPFFVGDSALDVRARTARGRGGSFRAAASLLGGAGVPGGRLQPRSEVESASCSHRLDHLALNPLENGISTEATWLTSSTPHCSSTRNRTERFECQARARPAQGAGFVHGIREPGDFLVSLRALGHRGLRLIPRPPVRNCASRASVHTGVLVPHSGFSNSFWHPALGRKWPGTSK